MHKFTGIAKAAITAGLSLSMLCGNIIPAFADERLPTGDVGASFVYGTEDTETQGQTRLYVKGNPITDLKDEAAAGQYQVTIPVGLHFVATTDGTILGPSDGTALFQNKSTEYNVHIAKIGVKEDGDAKLVATATDLKDDQIYISMAPTRGKLVDGTFQADEGQQLRVDSLGNYLEPARTDLGDNYDIAMDGGVLALNKLGGKIGGFDKMNPATDTQVGTVSWVVRAGTRHEADIEDCSCTLRYHANGGTWLNEALPDQRVEVADPAQLPRFAAKVSSYDIPVAEGEDYLVKYYVNDDGTVDTKQFKGWYLEPHRDSDNLTGLLKVATIGDLIDSGDLAGATIDLYAAYGA